MLTSPVAKEWKWGAIGALIGVLYGFVFGLLAANAIPVFGIDYDSCIGRLMQGQPQEYIHTVVPICKYRTGKK